MQTIGASSMGIICCDSSLLINNPFEVTQPQIRYLELPFVRGANIIAYNKNVCRLNILVKSRKDQQLNTQNTE
jgi:hypothetical protein